LGQQVQPMRTTVMCGLYCAALLLALTAPNVELVGISAVHGNVVSLSGAVYFAYGLASVFTHVVMLTHL